MIYQQARWERARDGREARSIANKEHYSVHNWGVVFFPSFTFEDISRLCSAQFYDSYINIHDRYHHHFHPPQNNHFATTTTQPIPPAASLRYR
jgi:hypothetical protein